MFYNAHIYHFLRFFIKLTRSKKPHTQKKHDREYIKVKLDVTESDIPWCTPLTVVQLCTLWDKKFQIETSCLGNLACSSANCQTY